MLNQVSYAKNNKPQFNLYEQASEIIGLTIKYHGNIGVIKDFHSPGNLNPKLEEPGKANVLIYQKNAGG